MAQESATLHLGLEPAGAILLTGDLWVQVGQHVKRLVDLWSLTATCRAAHRARLDPALPAGWLTRRPGSSLRSALLAAVAAASSGGLGSDGAFSSGVVAQVLRLGADPNAVDDEDTSALMIAAQEGSLGVTRQLLASGASIDARNEDGWSALCFAARLGCEPVVRHLLSAGADVRARTNNGSTLVVLAATHGDPEVLRALLAAAGGEGLADVPRGDGVTPLMLASEGGHAGAVRVLLREGRAAPNAAQSEGTTALLLAAERGRTEVVDALLDGGADPTIVDEDGVVALHGAAHYGRVAAVETLLAHGADPDVRTPQGHTPLMLAADGPKKRALATVRCLLEEGADPNVRSNSGETALSIARQRQRTDVCDALLSAGSKLDTIGWIEMRMQRWRAQEER